MDKDNTLLGQFTMKGIPAAPKGQEKFIVTFDLDADSILKVTAKNKSTGKTQDITIDAKAAGRLTTEEVNKLVEKADEMKITDDQEEKRALAKDSLESLCSDIRMKSQTFPKEKLNGLLEKVNQCIIWLKENHNEAEIESKQETLLKEANKIFRAKKLKFLKIFSDLKSEAKISAEHLHNLSKLTPNHCLQEGWNHVAKGTKEDLYEALNFFSTAYTIRQGSKRKVIHMTEANIGVGHVIRKLLEQENDESKVLNNCIKGAQRLSQAMELDKGKILSKERRAEAIRDFAFIGDKFFQAVGEIDKNEGWRLITQFLRTVENDAFIDNSEWKKLVLNCCLQEVNFCTAMLKDNIEANDFAATLNKISGLTFTKEQLERLVDSQSRQEVSRILADLVALEFTAKGMKELFHAQEALNSGQNQLDRALLALDHINEAKVLTKIHNPQTYWRAKLYEGNIFQQHLKNRTKAKSCFTEILESSAAKNHDRVYAEAKLNLKHLEEAEAEANRSKPEETNLESILEDLSADVKKLDDANQKMQDEEFLDFLLKTFPPQHRKEYLRPDMTTKKAKKKAITKVSMYYHPDKVDAAVHGQRFKKLCEEITKRLSGRLARYRTL